VELSVGGTPGSSTTVTSGGALSSSGVSVSGPGIVGGLGVLPPPSAIPWVPLLASVASTSGHIIVSSAAQPTPAATPNLMSVPPVVASVETVPGVSQLSVVPAGSFMAEGLLPVPEKLAQKIIRLEFVEMRELMPETWLRDEEETSRNTLAWPRRKVAPVTDILVWLSCYAAMVGVLSRAYPQMVPEFMAYQATIIKCCRDFDGIAWAQYDRVYRRQVAQTKDLHWSKLNPTLYSLCFAGKAKRHVACHFCLSDIHSSDQCPDNPAKLFPPWQQPMPFTAPVLPAPKLQVCHLFNSRDGPRCTYRQCKFAHICSLCRGSHPRSICNKRDNEGPEAVGRSGPAGNHKRLRQE